MNVIYLIKNGDAVIAYSDSEDGANVAKATFSVIFPNLTVVPGTMDSLKEIAPSFWLAAKS